MFDVMTASNVKMIMDVPILTVTRVDESVIFVSPLLNGYDYIHLPFAQNDKIQLCPMIPSDMDVMLIHPIYLEPVSSCVTNIVPGTALIGFDEVGTAFDGVDWTVNFIGDPSEGVVQFISPDNYALAYMPNSQFFTQGIFMDSTNGVVFAEPVSKSNKNNNQTYWKLQPAPPDNEQQLWWLQAYNAAQAGSTTDGVIGYCEDCGFFDTCRAQSLTFLAGGDQIAGNFTLFQFVIPQ